MVICELTGIIGSVGADGRLVHSLNGRMVPSTANKNYSFTAGRSLLQIITKNRPVENVENTGASQNKRAQPSYSQSECQNNKCLEIRFGDCALIDHANSRETKVALPEVCLGRRLESLNCMDFSCLTPALTVCGGEAGLAFIIPCTL